MSTPKIRPGNYGAGKGATQKLVRLEGELLQFVEGWPGGLRGVVEAAYAARKKLKRPGLPPDKMKKRLEALDELTELTESLGLYEHQKETP